MLKCNTTVVLYASVVSNSSTSKQLVKPSTLAVVSYEDLHVHTNFEVCGCYPML